jgi:hypothetical protein
MAMAREWATAMMAFLFGHTPVDAWSAIQTVDVIIVFAQQRFDVRVQLRDLNSKEPNVCQ